MSCLIHEVLRKSLINCSLTTIAQFYQKSNWNEKKMKRLNMFTSIFLDCISLFAGTSEAEKG